jgi:hypothetical protein
MAKAEESLTKRETLPVTDDNGRLLGICTIRKFTRRIGEAYNRITLYDIDEHALAEISGYRLHSRIWCGDYEGTSKRIDSKDSIAVARAALAHAADSEDMLRAIQDTAETLAEERSLKRRRARGRKETEE